MTDKKIEEALDEELERLQASENLAAVENSDDIGGWEQRHERLADDFSNYKKRVAEERAELREKIEQELLQSFLTLYDDFQRLSENHQNSGCLAEGVEAIQAKWQKWLRERGVQVLKPAGEDFDPEHHEAVKQVPVAPPAMHGKVAQVIENGYLYKDRVLRCAKVAVGRFKDSVAATDEENEVKGEFRR